MTVITRNYNIKDVDMIVTASTILESAINHKEFLIEKRPIWADPFFSEFELEIDQISSKYLGVDSGKKLRKLTNTVYQIQREAIKDLAEAKIQIEEDFKDNKELRDEIIKQLGYQYYFAARQGDQEALINQLYQFKNNIQDHKALIISKGTNQKIIQNIIDHTLKLKELNVDQETNKGTKKEITQEARVALNQIYDKAVSIARISHKFFKGNKTVQDQFSFFQVAKKLNSYK